MNAHEPLIQDFMTLQPQTIESGESVAIARDVMSRFDIRHLPVVEHGIVVGLLSEREVNLAAGIESVDPNLLRVIDVCSERPFIVHPDSPLRQVVGHMAERHIGSAIVMDNARLVGIFTNVDACRALRDLIEEAVEETNLEQLKHFRFFLKARRRTQGKES